MATPIEQLRQACLERGVHGIYGIGRVFRQIDENGSRSLDRDELASGLNDFGVSMTSSSFDELFTYLDRSGLGVVTYDEFLEALRPPMSQTRFGMISQAFDKLDQNYDGCITIDDLRQNYSVECHPKYKSGEMTEDEVLTEFLSSFQTGEAHGDKVTRKDFINYYSGVSASIDDDEYFVYMMQQAWKI